MAASMMIAGVGGRKDVSGRRIAIPEVGPIPGSTPTRVPRTDPISAKKRFCGVRACPKPWNRKPSVSTSRERHAEPAFEDDVAPDGDRPAEPDRHRPPGDHEGDAAPARRGGPRGQHFAQRLVLVLDPLHKGSMRHILLFGEHELGAGP